MDADLYAALGVAPDADAAGIRTAYRTAALELHPDRSVASSTAAFVAMQAAYEVLSDPVAKKGYDAERDVKLSKVKAVAVAEEVVVDDMDEECDASAEAEAPGAAAYYYPCRCGDRFCARGVDLLPGTYLIVECSSCSLKLRVYVPPGATSKTSDSGAAGT